MKCPASLRGAHARRVARIENRVRQALARCEPRGSLVVTDDPLHARTLREALEELGGVAVVWSAADLWHALATSIPALVVFAHPSAFVRDGELPRTLRQLAPDLPIVLVGAGSAVASIDTVPRVACAAEALEVARQLLVVPQSPGTARP